MKKKARKMTRNILILVSLTILIACQSDNDRDSIKKQIADYRLQVEELNKKIENLEMLLDSIPSSGEEGYRVAVEVEQVVYTEFKHYIEVGGVVEAISEAHISPEISGQIERIYVSEGQWVSAGQLLAEINSEITRNQISEIESSLDYARIVFEKQKRLWDQRIGSEMQYLNAKNNVESLENRLNTLKAQLGMARITSPVSGVVDEIERKQGELALPGSLLMQIVNLDQVYINAAVSEAYLAAIRVGENVEVFFPAYPGLKLEVPIHRKGNVINPDNRTFIVQLKLSNPDKLLKPNILSKIYINDFTSEEALTVPASIVKQDLIGSYVYVVDDNDGKTIARKAYVQTGLSYSNETMITEGIEPGQLVIVNGYNQVSDGTAVVVQTNEVS
jgi:RND family efflux transporter MFP subunit